MPRWSQPRQGATGANPQGHLAHRGLALVDVISPCVTFHDHAGSTRSYVHTRQHQVHVAATDFVSHASEIVARIGPAGSTSVTMHDGSVVRFTAVPPGDDPTDPACSISTRAYPMCTNWARLRLSRCTICRTPSSARVRIEG